MTEAERLAKLAEVKGAQGRFFHLFALPIAGWVERAAPRSNQSGNANTPDSEDKKSAETMGILQGWIAELQHG